MIKVDLSGCASFFDASGPDFSAAAKAHRTLLEKTGEGAEFTGWMCLPQQIKLSELKSILAAANKIRGRSKALVVIGIGGSYLGARAAIELLRPIQRSDSPRVFFAGNGLSGDYLSGIIEAHRRRRLRRQRHKQVRHHARAGALLPRLPRAAREEVRLRREAAHLRHDGRQPRRAARHGPRRGLGALRRPRRRGRPLQRPLRRGPAAHGRRRHRRRRRARRRGSRPSRPSTSGARRTPPGSTPPRASSCTRRATASSCSPAMSRASGSWPSGGSSSTARARARTA